MRNTTRLLQASAILALFPLLAVGQIVGGGGGPGPLSCTLTPAGTPDLRPEGYTELAGDILIICEGGAVYQTGVTIPTTNLIVYLTPGVPVTSRFLDPNGASDALLLIDEPGSGLTTQTTGAFGPNAPQVLCPYAQAAAAGCPAVAANDGSGVLVAASRLRYRNGRWLHDRTERLPGQGGRLRR